jgi:hypothetical protein
MAKPSQPVRLPVSNSQRVLSKIDFRFKKKPDASSLSKMDSTPVATPVDNEHPLQQDKTMLEQDNFNMGMFDSPLPMDDQLPTPDLARPSSATSATQTSMSVLSCACFMVVLLLLFLEISVHGRTSSEIPG